MERSYPYKRVLITGADGFIGSALAIRLAQDGVEVSAVARPKGEYWRLNTIKNKITILEGDMANPNDVNKIIEVSQPECIFNVASLVNTSQNLAQAEEIIRNTYGIAKAVANAAIAGKVKRVVQFGSIAEYGASETPNKETDREEAISPYSLGKIMGTQYVLMAGTLSPLEVVVVRPAATYGPMQGFGMLVPNVIKSALEGKDFDMNPGEQRRDFLYIDDLVDGVIAASKAPNAKGEIVNFGSNTGFLVKEVVANVVSALGNPIKINFGAQAYRLNDKMTFYMDSTKAKNLLGWEPRVSLEEGIKKTVEWYREHYQEIPHLNS